MPAPWESDEHAICFKPFVASSDDAAFHACAALTFALGGRLLL